MKSLEDAIPQLRDAYEKGDSERFNKMKRFILKINEKIEEISR